MYLKKLKIWNFRCFGSKGDEPGLEIEFDSKVNLLIGANDSGKTAIIDAIRYCLGTQTFDPIRIEIEDFYQNPNTKERANEFKIECTISAFSNAEAGQFLEWINIDQNNKGNLKTELKVWLTASNKNNRISSKLRAGTDPEGLILEGEPRDLLRTTYLKPLRDAENELTPGYRSRLYQILRSHPIFEKKDVNKKHPLENAFKEAGDYVLSFFEKEEGKDVQSAFESQTEMLLETGDERRPKIKIAPIELNAILRKLELILEENKTGLGTLNLLYMAAELIHLKREQHLGLRLALIEELEAHLHPQAQLRVLKSLLADKDNQVDLQYIFTTHSTLLGSSIPLKYIYLCFDSRVYPLNSNATALEESDYQYLERFLDATKANLFFAKGVLLVEGDAENILLPTLAEIIDRPLHKYGVSIVKVGSKAMLRYAKIFQTKDGHALPIRVAVITDLDIPIDDDGRPLNGVDVDRKRQEIIQKYSSTDNGIKAFVSPFKTLEFDIAIGHLDLEMFRAIQLSKKVKSKGDWITNKEFQDIMQTNPPNEKDLNKRAKKIYEPLEKNQASKAVAAQWFAKLLSENRENVRIQIQKDYKEDKGIKYLIEAIEHVTEKISWGEDDSQ